jgi:hypothetical protein
MKAADEVAINPEYMLSQEDLGKVKHLTRDGSVDQVSAVSVEIQAQCGCERGFLSTDEVFVVRSPDEKLKFVFVRIHDPLDCIRLAPDLFSCHSRVRVVNRPHLTYQQFGFEMDLSVWWQRAYKSNASGLTGGVIVPKFVDSEARIHVDRYPLSYDERGVRILLEDYCSLEDHNQGTREGLAATIQQVESPHYGRATAVPSDGTFKSGVDGKTCVSSQALWTALTAPFFLLSGFRGGGGSPLTHSLLYLVAAPVRRYTDSMSQAHRAAQSLVAGVESEEDREALFEAARQALGFEAEGVQGLHQGFSQLDISLGSKLFIGDMTALCSIGGYPKLAFGRPGTDEVAKRAFEETVAQAYTDVLISEFQKSSLMLDTSYESRQLCANWAPAARERIRPPAAHIHYVNGRR